MSSSKRLAAFSAAYLFLASSANAVDDGKCRALVLSGGGDNGAWEAGVLWGLVHYGDPADYAWDVASGVSAGSINTALIATWPKGSEVAMTEWMSDKYASIQSNSEIWTVRSKDVYADFFEEPSLLNSDPALEVINRFISEQGSIERRFVMSATDVNTGDYIPQTQKDTTFDELALAALSSGSIPVVFQPRHKGTHLFMDGGTVWNTNLDSAIQQCLEIVDRNEDIIVDVLMTREYSQPEETVEKSAYKNWQNARAIRKYFNNYNSIQAQARAYPGIDLRFIFQEVRHTCPGMNVDFKNSTCWCMQMQGREDAKSMLEAGQESSDMANLDEWESHQEVYDEKLAGFGFLERFYDMF